MTRRRIIFLSVLVAYQLMLFIFTAYIAARRDDISTLTFVYGKLGWLKAVSVLGVLLVLAEVVWSWWLDRSAKKEETFLRTENEKLKAKLYDLQEGDKPAAAPNTTQR
ncbi:MAG: hypothetical protein K1X47_17160 [Cyclobacteriaceae bacterium]|nr:hypothetical protein [Cyclobacteriaceae bacterium]